MFVVSCLAFARCTVSAPASTAPVVLTADTTFPDNVVQIAARCADAEVPRWDDAAAAWTCAAVTSGGGAALNETAVDGLVANNGYLTSESDPAFSSSPVAAVTQQQKANWDAAYGWGDHATQGYLSAEADPTVNGLATATLAPCFDGQVAKFNAGLWECQTDLTGGPGVGQWADVTGGIAYSAGRVGIGTLSPDPTFKLHVDGMVKIGTTLQITNTTGTQMGTLDTAADTHGYLRLTNAGTTNVLIRGNGFSYLSGGNVGIGTSAPGQALEVNGGARLNTAAAKPTCDATTRGTFWVSQGAGGVKDSVEVCAKDASDSYAWRTLY
ncbi:MAG: hypothetical protein IT381_02675 [Deltaproteobacteria bacterium]|nr:hypothetical protein [Deltaproteobacteria bacterium]